MVTMKNIRKDENNIFADCFMEGDANKPFSLALDLKTFEISECSLDYRGMYASQAATKLEKLYLKGNLPAEATAMWC